MGMGSHASKVSTDCKIDLELQTLDGTFQVQTSNVLNSLGARSFNSRREITECLMEMNQEPEVVEVIHDCKNEIWKKLFEDYSENSQKTLDFCAALAKCLKSTTDSGSKTLEELKSLNNTSIYSQQTEQMFEGLKSKESELEKKIKSIQLWKKVSSMVIIVTFAALLIGAVVAAVADHPVAAALAVATSIPVGSIGKWIDTLFKDNENVAKGQWKVIISMIVGTCLTITDLGNIRLLVDKMETEIGPLLIRSDFSSKRRAAFMLVIQSLRISSDFSPETKAAFMNYVDKLGALADNCIRNIRRAKPVISKRIMTCQDKIGR